MQQWINNKKYKNQSLKKKNRLVVVGKRYGNFSSIVVYNESGESRGFSTSVIVIVICKFVFYRFLFYPLNYEGPPKITTLIN